MADRTATTEPPQTLLASLAHLGPGIVLASSIVGSGELIATTTLAIEEHEFVRKDDGTGGMG
jgi:hypothetical protein